MKLELKTENNNYSKSILNIFRTFFNLALLVIFCDVALKLDVISRHHQIEYNAFFYLLKNLNLTLRNYQDFQS